MKLSPLEERLLRLANSEVVEDLHWGAGTTAATESLAKSGLIKLEMVDDQPTYFTTDEGRKLLQEL